MIDGVSINNDNLVKNTGGGSEPSPPPSSPKVSGSDSSTQSAVDVDIRAEVVGDINKNSERVY